MWAGVFLWGSFASPDSPTGSALQPREGVHVHAGRPQKKSLARNIAGFLRLRVLRRSKQPWTSTKILMFAAGVFLSFLSQFCLGKFRFIVPWLRSIQIKSGAGMDLVTAGLWEMNLAQSCTMSVIDILLVFSLKVHGCYFTTSFQEIDCKSMFFFLPRPYLQK